MKPMLLLLLNFHVIVLSSSMNVLVHSPLAVPNCQERCGDVRIPYPFGIGASCYHNKSYEIICNTSTKPPKPFLRSYYLEVIDIKGNEEDRGEQILLVKNPPQNICRSNYTLKDVAGATPIIDLRASPFRFSRWYNILKLQGCGANVVLKNSGGEIVTGCSSICIPNDTCAKNMTNCYGVGMKSCQATLLSSPTDAYVLITDGLDFYTLDFITHREELFNSQTCNMTAGLIDMRSESNMKSFQTVLVWSFEYPLVKGLPSDSFTCYDQKNVGSQQYCTCNQLNGYKGNPHVLPGCNLMEECQKCKHGCFFSQTDLNGSGFYHCRKKPRVSGDAILGLVISIGTAILFLISYGLVLFINRIIKAKQKEINYRRNGGLLLQQQISYGDGVVGKTKIYRVGELEEATNCFSEDRILGKGGQGIVYKGMLDDGTIVAIKKSKVTESQLEEFVNEMVILSQINHRNVVRLLGCCLEAKVPLLVYEFVSNGDLEHHIHEPSEDFHITWRMRLRIASESASALAYLHSSSASPIFHRDIKTANILLDDKYAAKVADFGFSKAINIEQSHVTTRVIGTVGYRDPEYFQTNRFTEKSDVYSFGVVLIELITGKKAVYEVPPSSEPINLAMKFKSLMKNHSLFHNLDSRIKDEANEEEVLAVAKVAKQCLKMPGEKRPKMKEVAGALNNIWSASVSKPILVLQEHSA